MEDKIYHCTQCGEDLLDDQVGSMLDHAVPDVDDDGEVDGCRQCGPCQIDTEWANNRIAELEKQLADMTADRDSEKRWAQTYSDQVRPLESRLNAAQRLFIRGVCIDRFALHWAGLIILIIQYMRLGFWLNT
jgi:NMD protein affecting ribosome stability and mRNA decay